jgi:hypothetical protein
MDRKFLADLGLEKDVIDKILDQHGTELTTLRTQLKTKDTEIGTLRTDLTAANTKVADLEKVDVEDLQTQLQAEKDGRKKDLQSWNLKSTLTKAGCKDTDYIIFKLGDKVEFADDGTLKDSDALLESCKKDYAAMFAEADPGADPQKPTGGTGSLGNFQRSHQQQEKPMTKEEFFKLPYMEQFKLKNEQPEAYQTLMANETGGK